MNAEDILSDIKSLTEKKIRRYSEPGSRRRVRRPEEIIRDVRGLKLRQRVSLVLGDAILKDELEQTIKNSSGNGLIQTDNIRAYQDFLLPSFQPSLVNNAGYNGHAVVMPISDIKGNDSLNYSSSEKILRNKLASVYRLVDLFGWSQHVVNHISIQLDCDKEEFLLQPFGLMYNEVTASSLLKVNLEGKIIDGGTTNLGINKAGFVLHSCIHEARPDIQCVIHVHTPDVIAVSSMKCGFLRLSQESLLVGPVSYHDYHGILINTEEKESIKNDLGPENMVMFLRNHGVVVCGTSIEKAFYRFINLMDACETQVKAMPLGIENLVLIGDEAFDQVQHFMKNSGVGTMRDTNTKSMLVEEYCFEAYMRLLDSQGYRTGYIYKMPDVFISPSRKKIPPSQVPPQISSDRNVPYQTYFENQQAAAGMFGAPSMGRGNTHHNRMKWLNNAVQGARYVKEEKEYERPQLQPPNLDEDPAFVNGHAEENVTEATHNATKVVTKTTTVTETKVITENGNSTSTMNGVNEMNGVSEQIRENSKNANGQENSDNVSAENSSMAVETNGNMSKNGSSADDEITELKGGEINGESIKSPNKVKKQKSFKKAFMKKFKKDEKQRTEE